MSADRNLQHLYPAFREKYERILHLMQVWLTTHRPGVTCKLVEGYRTAEYQQELYAQGRTAPGQVVTHRSGRPGNESIHQSSLAADIGFFTLSKSTPPGSAPGSAPKERFLVSNDRERDAYYAHLCRAEGLRAGNDWKSKDPPHCEWPEEDTTTFAKAREWQRETGLRH